MFCRDPSRFIYRITAEPTIGTQNPTDRQIAFSYRSAFSSHAEKLGSFILRYGLVAILLYFGAYKFTASDAGKHILRSEALLNAQGNVFQQDIARRVPECVVDEFESVEVEKQQRDFVAFRRRAVYEIVLEAQRRLGSWGPA